MLRDFHKSSVYKEAEFSLEFCVERGGTFTRNPWTRWPYFHQSSIHKVQKKVVFSLELSYEKGFSLKIREEGVGIFTRVLCTRRRNFH